MLQCFNASIKSIVIFLLVVSFTPLKAQNDDQPDFFKIKTKAEIPNNIKQSMVRFENDRDIAEITYVEISEIKSNQRNGWVKFNLPNGKKLKLKTKNVNYQNGKIKNWFGREEEDDRERAALTFIGNDCRGFLRDQDVSYEIYPLGNDIHALIRRNPSKGQDCVPTPSNTQIIDTVKKTNIRTTDLPDNPNEIDFSVPQQTAPNNHQATSLFGIDPCNAVTGTVRVLVYFTPNAVATVPGGNIVAVAQNSIAQINQGFLSSGMSGNAELIDVLPFPAPFVNANTVNEGTNIDNDLTALRGNADVLLQRDVRNADVVMFLNDGNYTNAAGEEIRGIVAGNNITEHPADEIAFLLSDPVRADQANIFTVAHEFGHIFGARHQLTSLFPTGGSDDDENFIGHGHSWETKTSCRRRVLGICFSFNKDRRASIVHQTGRRADQNDPSTEFTRILRYSNPNSSLNGTPTGTSNANNALQILNQFATVANFEEDFPDFNVRIEGPMFAPEYEPYCLESFISCGQAPFTIQWEKSYDGFNFFPIGTAEVQCSTTSSVNNSDFLRVTVTDALNRVRTAQHTVTSTGGSPFQLREEVEETDIVYSNKSKNSQLGTFPNPAHEKINMNFIIEHSEACTIMLLDVTGKVVKQFERDNIVRGITQNAEINVNDIPNGIYLLKIKAGNEQFNQKVIVNH